MQIVLAACSLYESFASDLSRIEKHFDRAGMGLVQCIVAHDLVMRVIESFSRDRNMERDFANDL